MGVLGSPLNRRINDVRKEREFIKLRKDITLTSTFNGVEHETGKLVDATIEELLNILLNDDQDVMDEVKKLILNELYYRYKNKMV